MGLPVAVGHDDRKTGFGCHCRRLVHVSSSPSSSKAPLFETFESAQSYSHVRLHRLFAQENAPRYRVQMAQAEIAQEGSHAPVDKRRIDRFRAFSADDPTEE